MDPSLRSSNNEEINSDDSIPNIVLIKRFVQDSMGQFNVKIMNIESPSSFYLQLEDEIDSFKQFFRTMKVFYSDLEPEEPFKVSKLPVGSTWAVFHDNFWYRATVKRNLESDESQKANLQESTPLPKFEMLFVDLGVTRVVGLENIHYLNEQFQNEAPFAVHCRLAEVYPTSSRRWDTNPWSEDALDLFSEFCLTNDTFSAIFTPTTQEDYELQCSVILESSNGNIVNEELVMREVAVSGVISRFHGTDEGGDPPADAAFLHSFPSQDPEAKETLDDEWDPQKEAFAQGADPGVPEDDCAEAVFGGLRNRDDETLCRAFVRKGRCYRGDACHWRHAMPRADGLSSGHVLTFASLEAPPPLPSRGEFVPAMVSAAYSPHLFFVHLLRPELLNEVPIALPYLGLQRELKLYGTEAGSRSRSTWSAALSVGELMVAAPYPSSPLPGYHRVRVLAHEDDAKVKVSYIDVGLVVSVEERHLKLFSTQFLRPPPLAVNCYLADLVAASDEWSSTAFDAFAKSIKDKIVILYVAEVDESVDERLGVILLDSSQEEEVLVVNKALVETGEALYAPEISPEAI